MRSNKLLMAGVAGALLMLAPDAIAQTTGPYVGLSGGFNWLDDSDFSGVFNLPPPTPATGSIEFDTGWGVLGTLGYRFQNNFRTELELGYRENEADQICVDGFGCAPGAGAGELSTTTGMINLLYDIRTGGRLMPYIGGGLGVADIEDADDMVFAYQAIAGISYWISDQVELMTEYHFLGTDDPQINDAGSNFEAEYQSHALMFGLRLNFNKPRQAPVATPAVAAEPAPAPVATETEPAALPRNFLVFFDWDKSDITPEAAAILKDAADYAKANGATRIMATGHADRSGPEPYNMALSMRRAEAVKRQLLANGIAESEIGLDARGETDPLVPTEDGVREPQNRRVEIVLQ